MAAEIKLLVASPSAKNWPLALGGGTFLVLCGAAAFALQAAEPRACALLAAAGAALSVFPVMAAANTEYWVTGTRVVAREGLFAKSEAALALDDVVELRLWRSPVQRAMGLADLEVAGRSSSVVFRGVEDAEGLRDRILSLAP